MRSNCAASVRKNGHDQMDERSFVKMVNVFPFPIQIPFIYWVCFYKVGQQSANDRIAESESQHHLEQIQKKYSIAASAVLIEYVIPPIRSDCIVCVCVCCMVCAPFRTRTGQRCNFLLRFDSHFAVDIVCQLMESASS